MDNERLAEALGVYDVAFQKASKAAAQDVAEFIHEYSARPGQTAQSTMAGATSALIATMLTLKPDGMSAQSAIANAVIGVRLYGKQMADQMGQDETIQ